jgi:hypothetical protein
MIPVRLDSLIGSGATSVMGWHTQETAMECAHASVDTILVKAAITFSVQLRVKVKAIGRGVASVSCCGMAEMPPGIAQLGVCTPSKALEIILFRPLDDERTIHVRWKRIMITSYVYCAFG